MPDLLIVCPQSAEYERVASLPEGARRDAAKAAPGRTRTKVVGSAR